MTRPKNAYMELDRKEILFVVGMARSGTTWTQLLLAAHDDVASGRETHLMGRYIKPLIDRYDWEVKTDAPDGLHCYFSRRELLSDIAAPILERVLAAIAARKPGARIVLEKTPSHVHVLPLLQRILPDRFKVLHVIRDPRSVCASWQAASEEEWGQWTDQSSDRLAQQWTMIQRRRPTLEKTFGDRYCEVNYEDLSDDTAGNLARLFGWLDIEVSAEVVARCINTASLGKLKNRQATSDNGDPANESRARFFRRGETASWIEELSPEDITVIQDIAQEEMRALGYPF